MIKDYDKVKLKSKADVIKEAKRVLTKADFKKCSYCGRWFSKDKRGLASDTCPTCHKNHFGKEVIEPND